MQKGSSVLGLPLGEAQRRLDELGIYATVRVTGLTGRERAERRLAREGLAWDDEERVVQIRESGGRVELVVAATCRRRRA
ncbi:MAG TPA: hypothetical protein GXX28_05405 [Firmicutes bacterium]|nr:hypothetical protein [Bacillota bacterium]